MSIDVPTIPDEPWMVGVCTRPPGHDGEHSNVLHKPGADPDRDRPQEPA